MLVKAQAIKKLLFKSKYAFLGALFLFSLLLIKDVFGERTLIPNLEPYPDTFHYILPAKSLLSGYGLKIVGEGGVIKPSVPPLYSLSLVPFFALNSDARMFYFANVMFSIASLYLFYLILKRVSSNVLIIGSGLFFFCTNFFLYWYPQWAMAENLLLSLFLAGVYLLFAQITKGNMVLASLVGVSLYTVKYAAAPLTVFFIIAYLIKIKKEKSANLNTFLYFICPLILFSVIVLGYVYIVLGVNHFQSLIGLITNIFPGIFKSDLSLVETSGSNWWMSSFHLKRNFPAYLKATLGFPERFLWDYTPILPKYLAIGGYIGLLLGVFTRKYKVISFSLLLLLFGQMLFVSVFYAVDMRYIYNAIPTLLLGVVICLQIIIKKFKHRQSLLVIMMAVFLSFYLLTNFMRIKNQIVLNLRYAETPWYYISVLQTDKYFDENSLEEPVLISPMVPFLFDYYSHNNYTLLPLHPEQEFRSYKKEVYGNYDFDDLRGVYSDFLKVGRNVYVATYGLGNEQMLHDAFNNLNSDFDLILVKEGCYNQCNLYQLAPRD